MNNVHFSHKSDLWKTPSGFYGLVMAMGFFDPCPASPAFDGLDIDWKGRNFVNPPYSDISRWVSKAIREESLNRVSVLLLPARTDTQWFWNLYYLAKNVCFWFLKGRLHFNDSKNPAPFPSLIAVVGCSSSFDKKFILSDHLPSWADLEGLIYEIS